MLTRIINTVLGLPQPKPQFFAVLRDTLKGLRGITPTKTELVVVEGYMYESVTYSDGSSLLFRD